MIDLMELVVNAANKGIRLYVRINEYNEICIQAVRGYVSVNHIIKLHTLRFDKMDQKWMADQLLNDITYQLDKFNESAIRDGDLSILKEKAGE